MNELGPRVLVLVAVALATVGVIDAAVGRVWDHVVIFAVIVALLVIRVPGPRLR